MKCVQASVDRCRILFIAFKYFPKRPGSVELLAGHLSTVTHTPSSFLRSPDEQIQPPEQSLVQMGSGSEQEGSQAPLQMSYTSFGLRHCSGKGRNIRNQGRNEIFELGNRNYRERSLNHKTKYSLILRSQVDKASK